MMNTKWACFALLTAGLVEELTAFLPNQNPTLSCNTHTCSWRPLKRKRNENLSNSNNNNNNNIREHSRHVFQSTTNSVDSDDDYFFITPQALYTEDPNDQRYSASDWLANVKSLPRSTILRAIQGPVVSVMVWSFVVSTVHGVVKKLGPRGWAEAMCMSSKPHSFLVSALGLLLVFRTNSAYQRFAEGRKIWENILSISRNISRLSCLYERDMGEERRHRIFRLLGAFPYLLHHHIQPQCLNPSEWKDLKGTNFAMKLQDSAEFQEEGDYPRNDNVVSYFAQRMKTKIRGTNGDVMHEEDVYCGIGDAEDCDTCMVDRRALPWCLLPPAALSKCAESFNRPLWVCDRLSQELANVPYSDNFTSRERLAFLSQIEKLSKCIGECERIHQTAVPLNYARHSLRSLTIWLLSLPFALVGEFGMLTSPVMGVMSWLLFGVYQIGYTIEDPFQGSLRLSILCDAVYRDVMYDADLKNKRDSAYELEEELYEWDRLGPIEDSKLLLPESSSAISPPTTSESSRLHEEPQADDQILYTPDMPLSDSPPATSEPSDSTDDPLQPRP